MRKLVLSVIALLALFSVIRAFPQPGAETGARPPVQGVEVHPGLVEIGDGSSGAVLGFGLLARTGGREGTLWNLLPLRLSLRSGDRTLSLALNGMSFLVRGGVRVGRPVMVSAPVQGDVISVGGKVTVDSRVEGDVWTLGADVVLTSRAEVTGNVAALGGEVSRGPKSRVGGTVAAFPQVKIPLLGAFASQASVPLLELGREVLLFVLLAAFLFLLSYYGQKRMQDLVQAVFKGWRPALITVAVLLVAVPALVLLLVLSVAGVYLLPVLALLLAAAALAGFLALCARIGAAVRAGTGSSALFIFTSGLLGLFLVKVPALAGILLGLVHSQTAGMIGEIARSVSLGATAAGMLWGVGAVFASTRKNAAG
jgi:hypothetical protein